MSHNANLNASSRIALAAFLHDLGKFAERARIPQAQEKDASGTTRQAVNESLYCPNWKGHYTHIHAAYTAMGLDLLEQHLPQIVAEDMTPFAPWRSKDADDSLINAAAKHHRPDTFLQWIIASADRLASGFERETFETYNQSPDETSERKLNHYTRRQETLLERIRLAEKPSTTEKIPEWRYPLKPLAPESIFPVKAKDCEHGQQATAQQEYRALWNDFNAGLAAIPSAHRHHLPLWLDHFESLWLTFTQAIPSATTGLGGKSQIRADVSLYDHSKTTAALAIALWRYHHDLAHDPQTVREQLRAQWDAQRTNSHLAQHAWEEEKWLLIQGDFFGIQHFIFAEGSQTQKRAAKLLRGRSFYVSLLTELAALKVLEALDLPAISQVTNAAGKFMIVAPNTPEVISKLQAVQTELDGWFLQHTYGRSGIGLAWLPAAAQDFRQCQDESSPFRELIKRLFDVLETAKLQRYHLCGPVPTASIFTGFLDRFEHGECQVDGRSPGTVELAPNIWITPLAADQINTGKWLARCERVLITRHSLNHNTLRLPIFGYRVNFTHNEEDTGKFGMEVSSGNLLRAWDFSLPQSGNLPLWKGYARRQINAYIPRFGEVNAWDADRYQGIEHLEDFEPDRNEIKTLNHLARDDRQQDENGQWRSVEALMTLKGDVDNLGLVFQQGIKNPTFAKMAALSRQINAFFAIYLPWLCSSSPEFSNTYTVFAGGDDFFLIGPWHSTLKLAQRMETEFQRFVAHNPELHFSAGLSMTKPSLPIRQLAALAEHALDQAKAYQPEPNRVAKDAQPTRPKNAVTCFNQTVAWADFARLMAQEAAIQHAAENHELSSGYLYGLLHLTDMAGQVNKRPENALWHSYFRYRTRRLAETRYKEIDNPEQREEKRRRLQQQLAQTIASDGIERHGNAYKITLFAYLYQQRN